MTENDIKGYVALLLGAIETNNDNVAKQAAAKLIEGFLIDINCIADALAILAQKEKE